ncbi:MAG: TlpA family protein disulfide reductase [Methylovulum sp.]
MRTKAGLSALMLLLAILAGLWLNKTPHSAPDVIFTTITGKHIDLKDLRGKPVFVTFWATDCPSCIKEIPHLIELYKQYHRHGLEIIAVAMYYDPPSHVVSMTEAMQLPYPVALDLKAEHAHAFGGVQLTPSSFLITPDGFIALHKIGVFDPEEMKTTIKTLLKG